MKQPLTNVNRVFEDKYGELKLYASKAISKYNRKYKAEIVISESYLYIVDKDYNKILTDGELEGDIKKYIKNNIVWSNGFLNKETKTLNNINMALSLDDICNISADNTLYSDSDIEDIIEDYIGTLNNIDKRLFSMYYYRDINTVDKIKKHLSIGFYSASMTLKECVVVYNGLREFIKNKSL